MIVGDQVDVEATELQMKKYYSPRSNRRSQVANLGADNAELSESAPNKMSAPSTAKDRPDAGRAADVSLTIDSGACDLAAILLRHLPLTPVRAIVSEWVQAQRLAWTGRPIGPPGLAAGRWPKPPAKCAGWWSHPAFKSHALSDLSWAEAVETAAEWRRARGLVDP